MFVRSSADGGSRRRHNCMGSESGDTVRQSMRAWFKAQFVNSQTRRDEDLEHWWQLPDDQTRTASPWLQLLVDLTSPAAFSDWHEQIATARVGRYDRLRPAVTRAVLLGVIGIGLWLVGAAWWTWIMLVPALLQVALEAYLHRYIAESAPDPKLELVRDMRDVVRRHMQSMLLNVTGILGTLACPLNIAAVAFAPGVEHSWAKIAALIAAIFYVNSGLASALLDPPNYTENSLMPPIMHILRPYAPLLSLIIVMGIVGGSVALGRWDPALTPVALVCATLTLVLGSTIRTHDRVIDAAAVVGRKAVEAGRRELGGVVHDDLGPAKAAAESVSQVDGVEYWDAVDLASLSAFLTHFNTRLGVFAAQRMELSYLVGKLISPYGVSPRNVTYDIGWDEKTIRKDNHQIAIRMTTALVHNVGQMFQKDQYMDAPKTLVLEGFTTGTGRELHFHLGVRDHLPVIGDEVWCAAGGTLAALRSWLRDRFDGDLVQEDLGDGTKRIVASWADRPPKAGYGDPMAVGSA